MGDPTTAYELYYSAFNIDSAVYASLSASYQENYNYKFQGRLEEEEFKDCPLCGVQGEPYWCYCLAEYSQALPSEFNPVRMWLRCGECNHLFAASFPKNWGSDDSGGGAWTTNKALYPYYEAVLDDIEKYSAEPREGGRRKLLEVGLGGCECIYVAHKRGYKVLGVDSVKGIVNHARNLGLNAEFCDFYKMDTGKKWNVLIMGDVVEHVPDPVAWLKKCVEILTDDGALWISTPDFESEFTKNKGHSDPMRREVSHINYFSRESLYKLLDRFGLEPVENKTSDRYNGSMEVIAVKKGN
jgi:SAM-dependent methyltransferase